MPGPHAGGLHQLLIYRHVAADRLAGQVLQLAAEIKHPETGNTVHLENLLYEIVSCLVNDTYLQSLGGDLWKNHLLRLIAADENIFSLNSEKYGPGTSPELLAMVRNDLAIIRRCLWLDLGELALQSGLDFPFQLKAAPGRRMNVPSFQRYSRREMDLLYEAMELESDAEIADLLARQYGRHGCGLVSRFAAFRWEGELEGIEFPDPVELDDLVGYERHKRLLINNTEAFLGGRMANNALLHGEKGTGKSSSVKALLNRFAPQGLRMVELPKQRLSELGRLINLLKTRGLHYIVFIDDLSFEDFEIDYKHIKGCIEGSLEVRPDNVLLYVTSNRRNLIKENFQDRRAENDEVHVSDSYQEKTSFADRFGLSISYYSPDKEEYLAIVETLAEKAGIGIGPEELRRLAVQWAVSRNGWSGRVARQFIYSIEGA